MHKLKKLLSAILALACCALAQASGLYAYEGGYFVNTGNSWQEFRPQAQEGAWRTYTEQSADARYHYLVSGSEQVAIPVDPSTDMMVYARQGGSLQPLHKLLHAYDYFWESETGRRIYCYDGGYMVRRGISWIDYRPQQRHMPWAQFEQFGSMASFIMLRSASDTLAVPKDPAAYSNYIYIKRGDGYDPLYHLGQIYDSAQGFEQYFEFTGIERWNASAEKYEPVNGSGDCLLCIDLTGKVQLTGRTGLRTAQFLSLGRIYDNSMVGLQLLFGPLGSLLGGDSSSDKVGFALYDQKGETGNKVVTYFQSSKDAQAVLQLPSGEQYALTGCTSTRPADLILQYIAENP